MVTKAGELGEGIPVKVICVDNDVLADWAPAMKCRKIIPMDPYEKKNVWKLV